MAKKPLFTGLVYDDNDQMVETTLVGAESCYVVDDDGFKRHIPSEQVDRQVLNRFRELIEGHEEILSEQALKMLKNSDLAAMSHQARLLVDANGARNAANAIEMRV